MALSGVVFDRPRQQPRGAPHHRAGCQGIAAPRRHQQTLAPSGGSTTADPRVVSEFRTSYTRGAWAAIRGQHGHRIRVPASSSAGRQRFELPAAVVMVVREEVPKKRSPGRAVMFRRRAAAARTAGSQLASSSAGTLPPFSASFRMTCLCSHLFMGAVSFILPV
jgi:hypothetical protein